MKAHKGKFLGTSKKDKSKGYKFYARPDHYVYSYKPTGELVGYLCTVAAWERTYHTLLEK